MAAVVPFDTYSGLSEGERLGRQIAEDEPGFVACAAPIRLSHEDGIMHRQISILLSCATSGDAGRSRFWMRSKID